MKTFIAKTAGLLLAAPLALSGTVAHADPKLVTASPADGATVGSPQAIQLQFDEQLDSKQSAANLITEAGSAVPVSNRASGTTIVATPLAGLWPGRYQVLWRAVGASGDQTNDVYSFVVR